MVIPWVVAELGNRTSSDGLPTIIKSGACFRNHKTVSEVFSAIEPAGIIAINSFLPFAAHNAHPKSEKGRAISTRVYECSA